MVGGSYLHHSDGGNLLHSWSGGCCSRKLGGIKSKWCKFGNAFYYNALE